MVAVSTGAALALPLGYLLGSVPFGVILTRFAGAGDLRAIGSGNIGATNVLRTGRRGLAAATLVLDALKATLAVLLASWLFGPMTGLTAGAGALIGHLYPVWLKFRGGKGVATYLGGLIGTCWPAAIAFAVVWVSVAWATRYSSAAALAATVVSPLVSLAISIYDPWQREVSLVFGLLAALVWFKHSPNIGRLLRGAEPKIGQS